MKKIVKKCVLLIFIFIFAFIGIVSWVIYDTARIHTSQIELNKISLQKKEELIKLDFLNLTEYPSSLEFLQLRKESQIRETQYYIEFFNEITILKKYEDNKKNIYELQTNFTHNSKEEKWL